MNLIGHKVAILVDNYFEQSEFEEPLVALKNAGAEVNVISAENKELQSLIHVKPGDIFTADFMLRDITPSDYELLVLPGGAINSDKLRVVDKAKKWVTDFLDNNKPVAAICHAPWLLVSADIVEGRRLTSYPTIKDDIANAGGEWVDLAVVIDGSLITSRKPDDLPFFTKAITDMILNGPLAVDEEKINNSEAYY